MNELNYYWNGTAQITHKPIHIPSILEKEKQRFPRIKLISIKNESTKHLW